MRSKWILAVSLFVVGLMVLSALPTALAFSRTNATAVSPTDPTTGSVSLVPGDDSSPDDSSLQTVDTSWLLKVDSDLRDRALRGSKALADVVIYADGLADLAPVLNQYGVVSLPESFRGQTTREMTRTTATAGGVVSTRVTVPEYALARIAQIPGVLGIEKAYTAQTADYTNFELNQERERLKALREQRLAVPLDSGAQPLDWGTVQAQHAPDAWATSTGDGVNVAVQDWGTDFAHPNLVGRWATVEDSSSPYFGWPIMLSQNSMWLNEQLFTTTSDFDRYPYPVFASAGGSSWFSDTSYQATPDASGNLTYQQGYNGQYTKQLAPSVGCPGGSTRINRVYTVGVPADPYYISSASNIYHLGINKDKYLETLYCERPGVLVVDSTTPGVYDTVYVDLNDDYNFTNDKPVSIGDPLSGWDINGDGFYDVSGGLLYYISNDLASATDENVIAAATGSETNAFLAHGWIESDVQGYNLFGPTMALDGMYWPSAGEDIWEQVIASASGTEMGTTSTLTLGYNIMTGATVDTASLLAAGYPISLVYDFYSYELGSLTEGTDYTLDPATGEISWLINFTPGDTVEIIYQFQTWTVNYDSGEITFLLPPTAGSAVTATYTSGLPVPYSNITAQRQGWDLFVPGAGDMVAFYGPFELGEEHGTWVATSLAGDPVGNAGGLLDVFGTAPDVKIIGVDLPTAQDDAELFWFSSHGYDGIAGTGDEAQIATNSWGYIQPQETGFTFLERYLYDLTSTEVPDFSILFASGNLGPGYATSTPPNTAPGVITVGAGTLMNYRTLFGYEGGIAYYDFFGDGTGLHGVGPYGDMADFSSKGPTLMGTPEPDVFAVGAFAIGGRPLNSACIEWGCGGLDAWDLWSGTSLSTPVAAGVVALIYQAYEATHGAWPNSEVAKEILMSSADDHGFDVLQQGAGWVNATAAVALASKADDTFRVGPSFLTPGNYNGLHRPAFVNLMSPGDTDTQTLTVFNEGTTDETLTISDAMYAKLGPDYTFSWDFEKAAGVRDWRMLKPDGLYAADGITQLDATDLSAQWAGADFIRMSFVRDPALTTGIPNTFIEFFDWYNYTDGPQFNSPAEQNRFTFAGQSGGGVATIELYDPASRVDDGLAISYRDLNGATGITPVTLEFYHKVDWTWANAEASTGAVAPAGGFVSFDVAFSVPSGTQAGMYQGAIVVNTSTWSSLVPVLITVPYIGFPVTLGGQTVETTLYDNNGIGMGQIPGSWRQIGDSRLFWANFTTVPATNRLMIYSLLMQSAPSQGVITLYGLQPDSVFTDNSIYGPGTMVEIASNNEVFGSTNALEINKQFLSTAMLSGPMAIQMKAMNAARADEPFTLEIGYMETDPIDVRASTNKLSGSAHVSVVANVPLHDGLGLATLEKIHTVTTGLAIDPYAYPGGDFTAYLFGSTDRYKTVIPDGTIVATWSMFFYNGARDTDFGIFYDDNCDGVYTAADSAVGTAAATSANPETATLSFPAAGCYWVHAAGYDVDPGSLFDLTLDISKIGVSAFTGLNMPTSDVPANTPTGFDLAWSFPTSKAEGVVSDFVFLSPGFTPFALAQQIQVKVSYDLTPPSFSSPLPAPATVTSENAPPVFVQINDNQPGSIVTRGEIDRTTIKVWLDGADITSLATVTVVHATNVGYTTGTVLYVPTVPLADGSHTVIVQAGDFAGNLATTWWSFTVDTTAPTLRIDSPVPGLMTSAASIEITGTTDPGASVSVGGSSVLVDDVGRFAKTASLAPGTNAFEVTATDAIGNMASTTVTVVMDNEAPAISLLRTSTGLLTNHELTIVSGVVSEPTALTVAGIPATVRADGSFDATVPLVEGTNAIAVAATDAAGNAGTASITVVRDSTPPALTIAALPSETSSPTATVSGTVENGISFVTVNGAPVPVSGGAYSVDVALSYGPNTIYVTAEDAAGNPTTVTSSVSYIPTGVNTSTIAIVVLAVVAVVALLVGLLIGQMSRGRGGPPPAKAEESPKPPEEELPPEEGRL